jgi:hypothetical protein
VIKLGTLSTNRLDTCHPKIQRLVREVALRIPRQLDFSVVCGHRGEQEQEDALKGGFSKVGWPHSKHNALPSRAVDLAPYPIDWRDTHRFSRLAGYVQAVADDMGIRIRWLGDPDGDGKIRGQSFTDMPHFELAEGE